MDMTSFAPDNLTELLEKIVFFTTSRRTVLYRNLRESRTPGFVPEDMPVAEFAEAMNEAVAQHMTHQRLLFRDTANITFGRNGKMQLSTVADDRAQTLLQANPDEYLEHQIGKLLENSLNRAVAEDLLKIKRQPLAESNTPQAGPWHGQDDPADDNAAAWDSGE